jgi:hypothetical protein
VTITVKNPPPSTAVLLPSNGSTVSGAASYLDATASVGMNAVNYEITGGTMTDSVIATGTPTLYGWLGQWDTTSVPNGPYTLQSVAHYANWLVGATIPGITITDSSTIWW